MFTNCDKYNKELLFMNNYNYTFNVNCGNYTFKEVVSFGLSSNKATEDSNSQECKQYSNDQTINLDSTCKYFPEDWISSYQYCFGKSSMCQFDIDMTNMTSKCSDFSNENNLQYAFITYKCES